MIKWFKEFFGLLKSNKYLIEFLREEVQKNKKMKVVDLVCRDLKKPISWVDTSGFQEGEQRTWYNEAQSLKNNPVFKSLCGDENCNGEITKDIIEYIAKQSKDFQEVLYWRAKIAGIELLKNLIYSIPNPDQPQHNETPDLNDIV
jgi:peptide subunit release factor 1 (eRF1)